MTTLFFQIFHSQIPLPVDSLDFRKTAQTLHLIDMKLYIFNEIDFSLLVHHRQHSQSGFQNVFQLRTRFVPVKNHIGPSGAGYVGADIVDQAVFDVSFPQFQPAVPAVEVGVDLVITACEISSVFL